MNATDAEWLTSSLPCCCTLSFPSLANTHTYTLLQYVCVYYVYVRLTKHHIIFSLIFASTTVGVIVEEDEEESACIHAQRRPICGFTLFRGSVFFFTYALRRSGGWQTVAAAPLAQHTFSFFFLLFVERGLVVIFLLPSFLRLLHSPFHPPSYHHHHLRRRRRTFFGEGGDDDG